MAKFPEKESKATWNR